MRNTAKELAAHFSYVRVRPPAGEIKIAPDNLQPPVLKPAPKPDWICLCCGGPVFSRGFCENTYRAAFNMVRRNAATWDQIRERGLVRREPEGKMGRPYSYKLGPKR